MIIKVQLERNDFDAMHDVIFSVKDRLKLSSKDNRYWNGVKDFMTARKDW